MSLRHALAIKEVVYGPEHPEVAITLTNLGIVQLHLEELEAAGVSLRRALAIKEAVYGPEHPGVAPMLATLGGLQLRLGSAMPAREHPSERYRSSRRRSGPRGTRREHEDVRAAHGESTGRAGEPGAMTSGGGSPHSRPGPADGAPAPAIRDEGWPLPPRSDPRRRARAARARRPRARRRAARAASRPSARRTSQSANHAFFGSSGPCR